MSLTFEPIKAEDLPNDVELLKDHIISLAYVKNGVIEARDDHVASLLAKVHRLECRLKWCHDRLAAANGTAVGPAATTSAAAEPVNIPVPRPSTPDGLYSPRYSPDYDTPLLPSVEEEGIISKDTSPARSTRSQTRAPSRVSKRKNAWKRGGKGAKNGKRDCVRRWSEGDRFDCGEGFRESP